VTVKEGNSPRRLPMWPLVVAPVVAVVYYIILTACFSDVIRDVVFDSSDLDRPIITGISAPIWGTHWIYRIVAESASVAFGTFIAAGIARERARAAAVIGGLGISLCWAVVLALAARAEKSEPGAFFSVLSEPWYHVLIVGGVILAAPLIGIGVSGPAKGLSLSRDKGFAGLPRLHFSWLWLPTHFYGLALIAPVIYYFLDGFINDGWWITNIVRFGFIFIFYFPLALGLVLLSVEVGTVKSASYDNS
jgi:hypothetical protein